jgi:hypothetical protein
VNKYSNLTKTIVFDCRFFNKCIIEYKQMLLTCIFFGFAELRNKCQSTMIYSEGFLLFFVETVNFPFTKKPANSSAVQKTNKLLVCSA